MTDSQLMIQAAAKARSVAVITGAGMSRESGIPTFRGQDGLWKNFRPEELASPDAFNRDPLLVWEWYEWRRQIVLKAKPHEGHHVVAQMEDHYPEFLLITQNVDGLHPRAGNEKLIEIHGSINRARCTRCQVRFELDLQTLRDLPLKCKCGGLARPDVVWFGESYDSSLLSASMDFLSTADMVWVIGSSGMVSVPVYLAAQARDSGAFLVDLNPEEAEFSRYCDVKIRAKAGEFLPQFWQALLAAKSE